MDQARLHKLLRDVKAGKVELEDAFARLKDLPFADLGYANLDLHRPLRGGFPEVVFGESKSVDQLKGIVSALRERPGVVIVTRITDEKATVCLDVAPEGRHYPQARMFVIHRKVKRLGRVAVVTAGTSDIPVAEEAAVTAEALGAPVTRIYDVGVAGIHRLLKRREEIAAAKAAVVIAGMEGALASAVGGLVGIPVVAVPTSVGYGASFGGVAALLGMLNSCSPNVSVVNIDNGFGGGFYASLIARK
ncbi:MAG: nickel pincer cofactor biosynthesis protein LarB [Deltaproteobacteria bacterium]|nr:nickel pincer cofactor biosynthesis protein LarB [Deltaproteobacteria bacterium]